MQPHTHTHTHTHTHSWSPGVQGGLSPPVGPTDRWDRKCVTGSNSDSGGHLGTTEPTVTSINPGGKLEASFFFFLETINCCQENSFAVFLLDWVMTTWLIWWNVWNRRHFGRCYLGWSAFLWRDYIKIDRARSISDMSILKCSKVALLCLLSKVNL